MRRFAANKAVRIISVIVSAVCFFLLVAVLFGIIFLARLGAYSNSYEIVRMSYANQISSSNYSYFDYSTVIDHLQNGTLDEYTESTGNLYSIRIGNRVLESNYNDTLASLSNDEYIPFTNSVTTYNNMGDSLVEYEVTIYAPVASADQLESFNSLYSLRYDLIEYCAISFITLIVAIFLLIYGAANTDIVTWSEPKYLPFTRYTTYLFAFFSFQAVLFIFLEYIFDIFSIARMITYCSILTIDYLLILNWFLCIIVFSKNNRISKRAYFIENMKLIFSSLGSGLKHLPLVWKTVILLALWIALELWIIINYQESHLTLITLFLLTKVVLIPFIISIALIMQKFKNAANKISSGDLNYRLYTSSMWGEFADFGDTLNNISYGMNKALDDRMQSELKSEHFKTELITNVSHDIKTPLTSIINYVDLIKKEEPENETVNQYIDVLDRQSSRLKKLLEDLIEASKALTGNLKVELVPCELNVLLAQITGEYEELLAKKYLDLVVTPPDSTINVMADVRHLWRVIDNLMTNIYKYSQENTRVYISLHSPVYDTNHAFLTFKNVSKAPLNITSDELMERFTRGDSSRNTEGSGLGLSIAKSLTELQGGVFTLDIDGDLFKAIIRFDVLGSEPEEENEDNNEQ